MTKKASQLTFERAMEELEAIVKQLEAGEISLEESIELYQQGMERSKQCHVMLETAEKKVQKIIEENGSYRLEIFKEKDGESSDVRF